MGSQVRAQVPENIRAETALLAVKLISINYREAQKQKGPQLAHAALLYSGSPTWTRTRDLRINSPSLYQLSYQGKDVAII